MSETESRRRTERVLEMPPVAQDAILKLNEALEKAGDNYVLLRAIESGKVDFWVIPQDQGVTLQTPPRQ